MDSSWTQSTTGDFCYDHCRGGTLVSPAHTLRVCGTKLGMPTAVQQSQVDSGSTIASRVWSGKGKHSISHLVRLDTKRCLFRWVGACEDHREMHIPLGISHLLEEAEHTRFIPAVTGRFLVCGGWAEAEPSVGVV